MKSEVLNVRMKKELKEKIKKNAEKLGLDASTFARMLLTKEMDKGGE